MGSFIGRKRVLTAGEQKRLKDAFEAGVPLNDLAKRFNVSTVTLQKILKKRS